MKRFEAIRLVADSGLVADSELVAERRAGGGCSAEANSAMSCTSETGAAHGAMPGMRICVRIPALSPREAATVAKSALSSERRCICGKTGTRKCSGCGLQHYCSRECQRADWKERHKAICSRMRKRRAGRNIAKPFVRGLLAAVTYHIRRTPDTKLQTPGQIWRLIGDDAAHHDFLLITRAEFAEVARNVLCAADDADAEFLQIHWTILEQGGAVFCSDLPKKSGIAYLPTTV